MINSFKTNNYYCNHMMHELYHDNLSECGTNDHGDCNKNNFKHRILEAGSWKLNECHMNIAHGKLLLISDALSDKTGHYYEHQWNANDYYNINNHTSAHKLVD